MANDMIHPDSFEIRNLNFQISLKVARDEHQKQEQLHLDEKQELMDRLHEKDIQFQVIHTSSIRY